METKEKMLTIIHRCADEYYPINGKESEKLQNKLEKIVNQDFTTLCMEKAYELGLKEGDKDIKEKAIEFAEFIEKESWHKSGIPDGDNGYVEDAWVQETKPRQYKWYRNTPDLYNSPEFKEFITPNKDKHE